MPERCDAECVIVGAGFAGASTAYHLARRGMERLVVLEQEATPGTHSSGRNASMIRQLVPDEALLPLAMEGARFIREAAERWGAGGLLAAEGSLLLAGGRAWRELLGSLERARRAGLEAGVWGTGEVERAVEAARGGCFEGAVHTPGDGVVDPHLLLEGFLRGARERGARVLCLARVEAIATDGEGRVAEVRAGGMEIRTPRVVNAAGAWAGAVAAMAGASPVPLQPYRRHLVFTGRLVGVSPRWPFVWNVEHEVYFRPESGGLLLSPCDQDPERPGLPESRPEALELLARKLARAFPRLVEVSVARSWAGLRTFAPDGRFVIGEDPKVPGFFWVAALGGHGVTTSGALGALAARCILGEEGAGGPFAPGRFAPGVAAGP